MRSREKKDGLVLYMHLLIVYHEASEQGIEEGVSELDCLSAPPGIYSSCAS